MLVLWPPASLLFVGTDLYTFAERRRSARQWGRAEPLVPNPFREDEEWMAIVQQTPGWEANYPALVRETIYDGRNRDLYDALAFGVVAGGQYLIEPVAQPRGLPDDVTNETRAEAEYQRNDAFGWSWLMVHEIEAYDWDREVIETTSRCMALEPGGEARGWRTVGVPPEGADWEKSGDSQTTQFGAVSRISPTRPPERTVSPVGTSSRSRSLVFGHTVRLMRSALFSGSTSCHSGHRTHRCRPTPSASALALAVTSACPALRPTRQPSAWGG
ncbi:hypothetical protein BSZ36_05440 [Rubricoccus marinus]|uniref:Uncharacterized protein n=1 Tax=Rubricoccus marinus TaxID=716817 RepID=A0A259TXP8_9BACT|nr:hypothetical protein BSZ36_05440 [Rubricoccus marinus]